MVSVVNGSLPSLVVANNMISSTSGNMTPGPSTTVSALPQQVITSLTQLEQPPSEAQQMLQGFWQKQLEEVQRTDANDFKVQELPLARIKKIMKMDDDVKMISAEAPLLFAKAAQMFITELSLRAWIHTEENKRRTLQRNDIATAISKFDQFDFLIDIVPREDLKPARRPTDEPRAQGEAVQYFYTLPQQQTQTQQSQPAAAVQSTNSQAQTSQIVLAPGGQIVQIPSSQLVTGDGNAQIVQIASQNNQQTTNANTVIVGNNQQPGNVVINAQQETQQTQAINPSILQQLITNSGVSPSEIHSIQISSDGQLQLVRVPPNAVESTQEENQQQSEAHVVGISTDDPTQQIFAIPATT
ncbi:unnamed protein product [Clavelina lepadiformis]|uniref:Nuclear transcription factor Y subunit gamma n=1 Tax=Clavelina lepadiformis TaxID=159417 RepID=A0ABP0GHW6_CLALP